MDTKELGQRIRDLRRKSGITLDEAGKLIGVHKTTLSRYELGMIPGISPENIINMCKIYGTTPNEMFGWNDSEETINKGDIQRAERKMRAVPRMEIFQKGDWVNFSKKHSASTLSGFLYIVQIGDLIKIGKSINPYGRIINLKVTFENYGDKQIGLCAISEEHQKYTENEKILHEYFRAERIPKSELFRVDFDRAIKEIENGWTGITIL